MMLKRILISLLAICFMIPSIKSGSVVADVNKAANTPESCVSVYAVITAAEQEYCVASGKQDCLTYAYVETAGEDDPSIISKEYTVPQDFSFHPTEKSGSSIPAAKALHASTLSARRSPALL